MHFVLHVAPHALHKRTQRAQCIEVDTRLVAVFERGSRDDSQETWLVLCKLYDMCSFEQGKWGRDANFYVDHADNR